MEWVGGTDALLIAPDQCVPVDASHGQTSGSAGMGNKARVTSPP